MGLAAEVLAEEQPRLSVCGMAAWAAEHLDAGDRAELAEMLGSRVKSTAIYRALVKRGFEMRYEALRRHRAGDCPCVRTS